MSVDCHVLAGRENNSYAILMAVSAISGREASSRSLLGHHLCDTEINHGGSR